MATALAERLEREEQTLAVPRTPAQRAALEALAVVGLPSPREENWKYANLRSLERVRLAPAVERVAVAPAALPPRITGFARQVFVDGLHRPELSDAGPASAALTFTTLASRELPAPDANRVPRTADPAAASPDLRFALLNTAFALDGARILVRRADEPVRLELVFLASADATSGASHPRIDVSLEPGARLQLLERHVSDGGAASFVNVAVQIRIGAGAGLCHYRIQDAALKSIWVDTLEADVARDAHYELHSVALGAVSARSTGFVRLAGEGAEARVYAVAIGERHQVLDGFVRVEHAAPHTRTEQMFRGIAAGRSRVAFNGAVVVRANARGADSRQSLRGLLAGPEAEIDARPQLEIYTDEVRATHGATAGTLDENMLFYLLSRGIDRATAQSLLEWAFLEDVVAKVRVPDLRKQIERAIAARVRSAAPLQELA